MGEGAAMRENDEIAYLVLTTAPPDEAERLAETLVRERLAAGINVIPGMKSFYWWQGTLHIDAESQLLAQVPGERLEAFIQRLLELHSYEVPEVMCFQIDTGHPAYLQWIHDEATTT